MKKLTGVVLFALFWATASACGGDSADDSTDPSVSDAAMEASDTSSDDHRGHPEDSDDAGSDDEFEKDGSTVGDVGTGNSGCVRSDQFCHEADNGGMVCKGGKLTPWTCDAGKTCHRREDGWLSCVSTVKEFSFDGLDCTVKDTYTTPNKHKLKRCVVKIGSVEMKVFAPAQWTGQAVTMALYLHGDGATPYTNNYAPKWQGDWVSQQEDLLYVVARAPNGCAWGRSVTPSYADCSNRDYIQSNPKDVEEEKNADALKKAIEGLRGVLPIRSDRMLYAGSSGGSILLTASWIPKYGDQFPGYYVLECGGEDPWNDFSWNKDNISEYVQGMTFVYGKGERLQSDIQEAYAYYKNSGVSALDVVHDPINDSNHCNYNQLGDVVDQWNNFYKNFKKDGL